MTIAQARRNGELARRLKLAQHIADIAEKEFRTRDGIVFLSEEDAQLILTVSDEKRNTLKWVFQFDKEPKKAR